MFATKIILAVCATVSMVQSSKIDSDISIRYWIDGAQDQQASFSLTLLLDDGTKLRKTIDYPGFSPASFEGGSSESSEGSVPQEIFDPKCWSKATLIAVGQLDGLYLVKYNLFALNHGARRQFVFNPKSETSRTQKMVDSRTGLTTLIMTMEPVRAKFDFSAESVIKPGTICK